jgi:hypothetical protein
MGRALTTSSPGATARTKPVPAQLAQDQNCESEGSPDIQREVGRGALRAR